MWYIITAVIFFALGVYWTYDSAYTNGYNDGYMDS